MELRLLFNRNIQLSSLTRKFPHSMLKIPRRKNKSRAYRWVCILLREYLSLNSWWKKRTLFDMFFSLLMHLVSTFQPAFANRPQEKILKICNFQKSNSRHFSIMFVILGIYQKTFIDNFDPVASLKSFPENGWWILAEILKGEELLRIAQIYFNKSDASNNYDIGQAQFW